MKMLMDRRTPFINSPEEPALLPRFPVVVTPETKQSQVRRRVGKHRRSPASITPEQFVQNPIATVTPVRIVENEHDHRRRVRFSEQDNRYYAAASNVIFRANEQGNLWYSTQDQKRFLSEYNSSTIRLEKSELHLARVWLKALQQTYQDSINNANITNSSLPSRTKGSNGNQEKLANMYANEPGLVGLEYVLLPRIRRDGRTRQQSLLQAIRGIYCSRTVDHRSKEQHIRLISEHISLPSRTFARDVAVAQYGTSGNFVAI